MKVTGASRNLDSLPWSMQLGEFLQYEKSLIVLIIIGWLQAGPTSQ